MLTKAVALSTLAALAAGELSHQALASLDVITSAPELAANTYVVPVEASPAAVSVEAIAAPEVAATAEFAPQNQDAASTTPSDRLAQLPPTQGQSTSNRVVVPTTSVSTPSARTPIRATTQVSETPNSNAVVVPTTSPLPSSARTPLSNTTSSSRTVAPSTRTPIQSPGSNDLALLATDVQVTGASPELQQIAFNTIGIRPGSSTSQSQLQKDVAALLNTGWFADARVTSSTHRDGMDVAFQVQPAVVRSLQVSGNQVLTPSIANDIFKSQLGKPISPANLQQAAQQLQQWYKDNGYVLAQVLAVQPTQNGVVRVEVAEGVVGNINVRFLDQNGKPTQGRTKEDFIRQELQLQPGEVFRVNVARQDLQQLYKLGLFDNANISLNGDARQVDVTYDVVERSARAVNAGGGYSADAGLFGTISYRDQNFGGINQQVGLDLQVGSRDFQFNSNFTSPYRASNPDRPGYNVSAFRRRVVSRTFDDNFNTTSEAGEDYSKPREGQFGGGVTLNRPVGEWDASVGLNYTRTSIRDNNGNIIATDQLGNPLSFSGTGIDDLVTVSAGVTRDQRNNPINPTDGSVISLSTEQSIPVGSGSILMNRLQANYSQYVPVDLVGGNNSEVLAFNVQGGTTIGDLPPYRAFNLGGLNSVRGYGTGDVGSGRSYVLASAEYRVPIFQPVGAVLFADFASDLGSGDSVPGDPAGVRDKPGTGFGYGAGLRVQSPFGIIRADYGFNDQGDSRLQFGLGQRF